MPRSRADTSCLRPRVAHVFRPEWRQDLFYFLVSSLLVQILTFFTYLPAKTILAVTPLTDVRAWVGALPLVVQFAAIMFLTDFVQYWVHRVFHVVPWLWTLASRHRERSDRCELCHPLPAVRPALWHLSLTQEPVAPRLRSRRASRAARLPGATQIPV